MKIIQKTIRKIRGTEQYRFNLKYENAGKIRVYSLIADSKNDAKNKVNFRLSALTKKEEQVDISAMLENRRKVAIS